MDPATLRHPHIQPHTPILQVLHECLLAAPLVQLPDVRECRAAFEQEGDEEDDDATLLTVQPGFNHLLLVLRDEGVMRFVKYVSAAAEGSRWDVCGEYEVGIVEVDDSDD